MVANFLRHSCVAKLALTGGFLFAGILSAATIVVPDGTTYLLDNTLPTAINDRFIIAGDGSAGQGALYDTLRNHNVKGTVTLADDATIGVDAKRTLTLSGGFDGAGFDLTKNGKGALVFKVMPTGNPDIEIAEGTLRFTHTTVGTYGGELSGSGTFVMAGSKSLTLTADNSFAGAAQVTKGTLELAATSGAALGNVKSINVNGGTLELGDSEQIRNGANLVIGKKGGTIVTNGHDETLGTLKLGGDGFLDLGSGDSILSFKASNKASWGAAYELVITNWSGSTSGGGTDQIYFGTNVSGLKTTQLSQIIFRNPDGFSPGDYGAMLLANGELVPIPVPEPAAVVGASLVVLMMWGARGRMPR